MSSKGSRDALTMESERPNKMYTSIMHQPDSNTNTNSGSKCPSDPIVLILPLIALLILAICIIFAMNKFHGMESWKDLFKAVYEILWYDWSL